MDTKIKARFWSDPQVEGLDSDGKLALLWLFTAHITDCGYVECSPRRFEFETASPWEGLMKAIEALGAVVVRTPKGFWVRNYIREQIGQGEGLAANNMGKSIARSLKDVPREVQALVIENYPELKALAKPYIRGGASVGSTGEERRGEENEGGAGGNMPPNPPPPVEFPAGFPDTVDKAINQVRGLAPRDQPPEEYLRETWGTLCGIGFKDGVGRLVTNWPMYASTSWLKYGVDWKAKRSGEGAGGTREKKERGVISPQNGELPRRPPEALVDAEPPCDWRAALQALYPPEQYEGADFTMPWGRYEPEMRREIVSECRRTGVLGKEWAQMEAAQ